MKDHLTELAERRTGLQAKAAAQRRQLGAHVDAIESRTRGIDEGFLNVRTFLRTSLQKPALLAGGAAVLFLMGPRRVLGLMGRAVLLASTARRLFRLVR